jgi:hypothetical protein
MKKVLIVGGSVLAIAIAGFMLFRSGGSAPTPDPKAMEAASKIAAESGAADQPATEDPNAPKSKADRRKAAH